MWESLNCNSLIKKRKRLTISTEVVAAFKVLAFFILGIVIFLTGAGADHFSRARLV